MEKDKDFFATPAEKMAGDISMLKDVQSVSEFSEEEKNNCKTKLKKLQILLCPALIIFLFQI